jgi:hypothetical protein
MRGKAELEADETTALRLPNYRVSTGSGAVKPGPGSAPNASSDVRDTAAYRGPAASHRTRYGHTAVPSELAPANFGVPCS